MTRAIRFVPDDVDAYRRRAEAYEAIGEIEKMAEDLDRAAEIELMIDADRILRWRIFAWFAIAAGCGFAGVLLSGLRSHSPYLAMLLGALIGPLGLVLLMILPEGRSRHTLSDRGPYQEEEVASTAACPTCGRVNSVLTRVCPRCETQLR